MHRSLRRIPLWVWIGSAALLLIAAGVVRTPAALRAIAEGGDVYAFLAGMIALSELARTQGVFDWFAGAGFARCGGSPERVFWLLYGSGVVVTALLSNDGTILLVTPAAIALARRLDRPVWPFAYSVAFVANAASFVLPISNPANLLLFPRLPAPGEWIAGFGIASLVAIAATAIGLRLVFRRHFAPQTEAGDLSVSPLAPAGRLSLALVCLSCATIVTAAVLHAPVGVTALGCAVFSVGVVAALDRGAAGAVLKDGAWSIIALVAGLFVVVQAFDAAGLLHAARIFFNNASRDGHLQASVALGFAAALFSNLANNLPAAVLAHYSASGSRAALVGIDLGPNAALSGSLATILWSSTLCREGIRVSWRRFLCIGCLITVPALALALLCLR